MFTIGRTYTRDEVHDQVGGSKQSFLPTVNNEVVCACLTLRLNPDAPTVILAGAGPVIMRSAKRLGQQSAPIPVFIKRAPGTWEFVGDWHPVRSSTDAREIAPLAARAGRRDVRVAVFLRQ